MRCVGVATRSRVFLHGILPLQTWFNRIEYALYCSYHKSLVVLKKTFFSTLAQKSLQFPKPAPKIKPFAVWSDLVLQFCDLWCILGRGLKILALKMFFIGSSPGPREENHLCSCEFCSKASVTLCLGSGRYFLSQKSAFALHTKNRQRSSSHLVLLFLNKVDLMRQILQIRIIVFIDVDDKKGH